MSPAVRGDKYLLSTGQPRTGLEAIPDLRAVMKSATSIITTQTLLCVATDQARGTAPMGPNLLKYYLLNYLRGHLP